MNFLLINLFIYSNIMYISSKIQQRQLLRLFKNKSFLSIISFQMVQWGDAVRFHIILTNIK